MVLNPVSYPAEISRLGGSHPPLLALSTGRSTTFRPFLTFLATFSLSSSFQCISQAKVLFPPAMAHRAVPISISIALGHASANAVKATAGAGPLVVPRV